MRIGVMKMSENVKAELAPGTVAFIARQILAMRSEIEKFYEDPKNQEGFRRWHIEKYGREPDE